MQIDIAKIIEQKSGKKLPKWIIGLLKRLIHEREINDILLRHKDKVGVDFLSALLIDFDVRVSWHNPEDLPVTGRYIFACNHPLGAFDGIGLSYLLADKYGDVRYLVNDMLYHIEPLQPIFLPVNTYGKQKKDAVSMLQVAMQSEIPIGTFPAGWCSRKINGQIQDREWHKSFISLAHTYQRDIVPLHFVGKNSSHFYLIDSLRRGLGVKFDLATALLPDEMFRAKGANFKVIVGEPISWQTLEHWSEKNHDKAQRIRSMSYELRNKL